MTPAGLAALKAELHLDEGCRLRAYQDDGGVWTIGWGHTGPEVRAGLAWTQAQADGQLEADIAKAEAQCARYIACWPKLDDHRQDVIADMAFNMGIGGLLKFHHMLAAVEAGDYAKAAADMLATQPWASQVGARAERLAALMRSPPQHGQQPANYGAAGTAKALEA